MTVLSVAIMAHVSREELYVPLAESLGSDVTLCVDDGTLGRWGNGRRSLLSYSPEATHQLVIQDDALPAQDLRIGLEGWIPHLPDSILCLYSGKLAKWRAIHDRFAQPPCWLQMEQIQWGVALVVPTFYIETLVARADQMARIDNYDMRLSEANLRTHRLPVLYPSPSWAQHAHTPSTVPGRKPNRHALQALTQEESALDWGTPGQSPIIRVPDFQRRAGGRQYYGGQR